MKFFNRLFVSKDGELSVIVSGDCLRDIRLHALQAQGVVTSDVAALDMGHVGAPWRIIKQVHRWGSLL